MVSSTYFIMQDKAIILCKQLVRSASMEGQLQITENSPKEHEKHIIQMISN